MNKTIIPSWALALRILAGIALCAGPAQATVTWTNTAGNWEVAANWNPARVPMDGDDVVITNSGANVLLSSASSNLNSLVLGKTLTFTNWNTILTATAVTILPNGLVTLPPAFSTNQMSNNVTIVCSNLFVSATGKIDADFKGWAGADDTMLTNAGYGTGRGSWTFVPSTYAGGGGYGGRGGHVARSTVGGISYGSETAPVDPGSGGGVYYLSGTAGAGGGAVRIAASGTVTINGSVSASGRAGLPAGGAGGSGGSVFITCFLFAGTNGAISADGGSATTYATGAGGGRVAVLYTNITDPRPTVRFSAKGGTANSGVGDLGTLCFSDSSILDGSWFPHSGRLVIPGFSAWAPASLTVTNGSLRFPRGGFHLAVAGDLVVKGSSTKLEIGGTDYAALATNYSSGTTSAPIIEIGGNLIVTNGATLCLYAAATNASTAWHGACVSVTGDIVVAAGSAILPYSDCTNGGSVYMESSNLTVATTASINADGKGCGGALYVVGSGYGNGKGSYAAGAGYGGKGGDGLTPTTAGGGAYGWSNAPLAAGSGGGSAYPSMAGGSGGGRVWLKARAAVTVNGTISANGQDDVGNDAGGGSGGGILIQCLRFTGSGGALSANGGKGGGTTGGGGGGGRIAVWTGRLSPAAEAELFNGGTPKDAVITPHLPAYAGIISVNGGAGKSNGVAGTGLFLTLFPPRGTVIQIR